MNDDSIEQLHALTERIERLVALCRRLGEENRSLRHSQETLITERAQLLAKNEQARSRIVLSASAP